MKECEPDDPMQLHAAWCDGSPEFMLDCVAEEYLRLGWTPLQILGLFQSPQYPVLHQMLRAKGVDAVRHRIQRVAARCGVFRCRTITAVHDGGTCDE